MREIWKEMRIFESINWGASAAALLRIMLIVLLAVIAVHMLQKLIRLLRQRLTRNMSDQEGIKRAETLSRVSRYVVSVAISAIAAMLILSEVGISIAPILGAAGVVGVAVGFGAQSLIKDYFNGFFILLENQIRQGDVVEAGGKAGVVEEFTLRYVQLRDYDGIVHYIPNSLITTVSNMGRGFANAVIDVGVAYREDVDEALAVMARVGAEMRRDEAFGPRILGDLEMVGVDRWTDSAVILRCRFMVKPLEQWTVRRECLKRLKKAFDAAGIEIPYPHLTVYPGRFKDGSAPPFHMLNAAGEDPRAAQVQRS